MSKNISLSPPLNSGLLESLCYTLYDALRPVIIHTNHLETLADLCTIFKVNNFQSFSPINTQLAADLLTLPDDA